MVSLYFMNKASFLPWYMGGSSSKNTLKNLYLNYPLIKQVPGLPEMYLASSGQHLLLTYWHLTTSKRRNDHIEMCLHHLLTLSLYYGAYITSDIEAGFVISFLMDFCDIWTHFAKAFVDTKYKSTCTIFGVLMWFFWGYTRIFCFPIHVYLAFIKYP